MTRLPRFNFIKGKRKISITPADSLWGFIGCAFIFMFGFLVCIPSILTGAISATYIKDEK